MQTTYELNEQQIAQVHQLYQQEWWTNERTLVETQKCIAGSQICIGLIDKNNNIVGFARVLTDYIFKALIFDLIIDRPYRKQGLGNQLLKTIKDHPKLQQVKAFELYCLPELEAFYKQHGFSADLNGVTLMRALHE